MDTIDPKTIEAIVTFLTGGGGVAAGSGIAWKIFNVIYKRQKEKDAIQSKAISDLSEAQTELQDKFKDFEKDCTNNRKLCGQHQLTEDKCIESLKVMVKEGFSEIKQIIMGNRAERQESFVRVHERIDETNKRIDALTNGKNHAA